MPITKSAIKAMRSSERKRIVNLRTKNKYKEALKNFRKAATAGKKDEAETAMRTASAAIDKAAKKNIIHANTASRLKSRMAKATKKLS